MEGTVAGYVALLGQLARNRGRRLGPPDPVKLSRRFTEADAALFAAGLDAGLLRIDEKGYLRTKDLRQTTAWLVEGTPCWPCWEYLPHGAAYVELIVRHGFPSWSVRFETPGTEHGLDADLAVVAADGRVRIMGEAKKESRELDRLLEQLLGFVEQDPGPPRHGDPRKAAWKLAHRLWLTRAPWLWLVGPDDRRAFAVSYEPMRIDPRGSLPMPQELDLGHHTDAAPPHITLP